MERIKIDLVCKIGGSLTKKKESLIPLIDTLDRLGQSGLKIAIIPGGGRTADQVREDQKIFDLDQSSAHWMAIAAMNINGYLIAGLSSHFPIVENPLEIEKSQFAKTNVAVFLPYQFLRKHDELPHSWDVTSDSICLHLACQLNPKWVVLLKDVDGIYDEVDRPRRTIETIRANDLLDRNGKSCVDRYLPTLIRRTAIPVTLISGLHPERLFSFLEGEKTIATEIIP